VYVASSVAYRNGSSITWRVPSYPFMSVACSNGERMYVRLRSEEYFEEQVHGLGQLLKESRKL
jgi:hypothetical protein